MRKVEFAGITYNLIFEDLLRPLTADELNGLRADIKAAGRIEKPIVVCEALDKSYDVIDGANRITLAAELGLDESSVQFDDRDGLSRDEQIELALRLNTLGRRITQDDIEAAANRRRAIVAKLRESGDSIRTIAEKTGVDSKTVQRDLAKTSTVAPATVRGKDGKKRAATVKKKASAPKAKDPEPDDDFAAEPSTDERKASILARLDLIITDLDAIIPGFDKSFRVGVCERVQTILNKLPK